MKIECNLNENEFDWWLGISKSAIAHGYEVERVYRDNEGVCVQLKPIVLSISNQMHPFDQEGK